MLSAATVTLLSDVADVGLLPVAKGQLVVLPHAKFVGAIPK
jgi:hypothetical protein